MRITINKAAIMARVEAGKKTMIPAVAEQALADCNYFARRDQGTMIQSSQTASNFNAGQLIWDTVYAKKVYYTGTPSTDVNPNASLMWCEKAKNQDLKDWNGVAQKAFTRGFSQ